MIGIGFITWTLIDTEIKFKYTTGTGVLQKKGIVVPDASRIYIFSRF